MKKVTSAGLSLPLELMDKIDKQRGDISRSRFVLKLIQRSLTVQEDEKQ